MSDKAILNFDQSNMLGKVASVDTSRVLIAVENAALLPRAAVGSLVAIEGLTACSGISYWDDRASNTAAY